MSQKSLGIKRQPKKNQENEDGFAIFVIVLLQT